MSVDDKLDRWIEEEQKKPSPEARIAGIVTAAVLCLCACALTVGITYALLMWIWP